MIVERKKYFFAFLHFEGFWNIDIANTKDGAKCSRMDRVKFVEGGL